MNNTMNTQVQDETEVENKCTDNHTTNNLDVPETHLDNFETDLNKPNEQKNNIKPRWTKLTKQQSTNS